MNRNVKILGRRFYSPILKDASWLEDAQLIFLISHTFVFNIWLGRQTSRRGSREKNLQTNVWKIEKNSSVTYRKATSFKLGEYNLLPSILMFWFTNCEKFNFRRSNLLLDSHANTVVSDRFAYPSRWRRKPW